MGSCDEVRRELATLGALRPEERPAWVRAHAADCASCARALWAQQVMRATLEGLLLQRDAAGRGTSDGIL